MTRFLQQHRMLVGTLAMLSLLITTCAALLTGNSYWHAKIAGSDGNLLTVSNALSPSNLLPRAYFERIKALPKINAITEYSSVALFLANERQVYTGVIVDKDQIATMFPRMDLTVATSQRWQERKDAILVSEKLLASRHLSIGDMVPSRLFYGDEGSNQEFYIAGTFGAENELKCTACVFLGRDFTDLALPNYRGVVGSYHVRVSSNSDKDEVRHTLDAMFAQEAPATRSTEFLPATSSFLNDLIDLRYLVLLAFWMTLATAIFLPALCANLVAIRYRASLALLLAFGKQKKDLLARCLYLSLCVGVLISLGGYLIAWLAGGYLFEDVIWLRVESARGALQGAFGVGILIALFSCLAVLSVIGKLEVGDLFSDATD